MNANNTLTLGGAATPTSPQQLTAINLCNQQSVQQNIGGATQIFTGPYTLTVIIDANSVDQYNI